MAKKKNKHRVRSEADRLLQEYVKLTYERCFVCSDKIDCGHHFFTKASSNALRYYLPNIIPLCKYHHCLVHSQPHLVEPMICFDKGQEWYDNLVEVKKTGVKANLLWYENNRDIFKEAIGELRRNNTVKGSEAKRTV